MTVTVTIIEPNLGKSLVRDTNANNVLTGIASPSTGSVYMVNVINPNATAVYFKLADANSGSVGTIAGDLVLKVSGCVTAAAEAAAVAPASPITASYVIGA